ncbi:transposase [Wolbachia pipientis]|uniref:transposase n=1 Tax=Wolbachia pipientis TaxID=955 RepID=UPI0026604165|nr:transposase [Wolbachia pipientis]
MYPSDISDKEWKTIEPYFEPKKTGRPRKYSIRTIINAIRYMMRTGCQWRQLPKDFPGNVQKSVSNRKKVIN